MPAARIEMLGDYRDRAQSELNRFRWRLFDKAVLEGEFIAALDIAAQADVSAADTACLFLAAIHDRTDIIARAIDVELDSGRMDWLLKLQTDIGHYKCILETVRKRPGILQIDLAAGLTGRDTKAATRMVEQLEATNLVVTKKVGSLVGVWPADHPQAPSEAERRPQRLFWDEYVLKDTDGLYLGWLDPAETIGHIENLMRLVEEAASGPGISEGLRPTPLDFVQTRLWQVTSPALSSGVPVYEDTEQLAMALWGHVDPGQATAIARGIIREETDTTTNQKKKWLLANPRHTHMERMPFTERSRGQRPGWLLREVPEPTENSVPVTAFNAAGVCTDPEKAAELGVACWLKTKKEKA